jgi:hypothetical protein
MRSKQNQFAQNGWLPVCYSPVCYLVVLVKILSLLLGRFGQNPQFATLCRFSQNPQFATFMVAFICKKHDEKLNE